MPLSDMNTESQALASDIALQEEDGADQFLNSFYSQK